MECLFFVRDLASGTSLVSCIYFVLLLIQHLLSFYYVWGSCVGYTNIPIVFVLKKFIIRADEFRERNHRVYQSGLTLFVLMLKE